MVFNQPVTLLRLIDDEQWEPFYDGHAYVNALYGTEYWAARTTGDENTVVFTLRYCRSLAGLHAGEVRVQYRGEEYDVHGVDNPQFGNHYIKLKGVRRRVGLQAGRIR